MRSPRAAELVLGGVQLGLSYGAANKTGKPSHAAALRLVSRAIDEGVLQFDTARAYGDSEERLGEALGRKRARAITKLSPLSEIGEDAPREAVCAAVDRSIEESLNALRRDKLDCLLLHRAQHMSSHDGSVWQRLTEHLANGTVLALGVSVQSPDEALAALACRDVTHIQLPFNIFDWRWKAAGVLDSLASRADVIVHARSAFLQGVFASADPGVWPKVEGIDAAALIRLLAQLASDLGRESVADLCLAYVRAQSWIDGVVVGLETEDQLETNLRLFVNRPLTAGQCALIDAMTPRLPEDFLNPARWPSL
jgi:aryl-alcohol dehydrogenase-like predicted oxidoreductase